MVIKNLEPGNQFGHTLLVPILMFLLGSTLISCAKNSGEIKTQEIKSAGNSGKIKTQDWVGHHRDELATRRGPPSNEARLAHGGRSLVYQQQEGSAKQRHNRCRSVFITDSQGIIQAAADYSC
jgi:hypothetical protein